MNNTVIIPFLVFVLLAAAVWQICRFATMAKDRAGMWYLIAAWAQANGDAAMIRQRRRGDDSPAATRRVRGVGAEQIAAHTGGNLQ